MKPLAIILAAMLTGCAALPLATQLSLLGAGVAVGGLAVTAYHDCRADGGCKKFGLPP